MEAACNVTAELDVIVAMAHAAAMAPIEYTRPVMKDAVSTLNCNYIFGWYQQL
jgi:DNA mismatch repair ATPase MutS